MGNKGILFDLDGTLWEVADRAYESINEIARKYGIEEISKKTVCSVFGLNRIECAQRYFPKLELKEALKLFDENEVIGIERLKKYGGNVYSGLEETLDKIKMKYRLFIVSNAAKREYIRAFLTTSGLESYFEDYVAASELNIPKSEAIKKVINEYKLEKAIYVGDTQKDMEESKLAGIPFIQAKYGFGADLKTEYYINEIKELPKVIEEIDK